MGGEHTRARQQFLFQPSGDSAGVPHNPVGVLTARSAGRQVLIVDDSSLVVDALRVLLEEHGHEVMVADSLQSARAAAAARKPDVVLLDIALPDGDGLDLVRLWVGPNVPVVLALTGHADGETRQRCLDAGCRQVLIKPVPTAELLDVIAQSSS